MNVRSKAAAELANVTYRQLNHWLTLGYVHASAPSPRADWAAFTPVDVLHVMVLGRCGRAGWSPQHVAPALPAVTIGTGPGWIVVTRDCDAPADTAFTTVWCRADELASTVADNPGPHVLTATNLTPTTNAIAGTRRTA
jgi:hypothetical protein